MIKNNQIKVAIFSLCLLLISLLNPSIGKTLNFCDSSNVKNIIPNSFYGFDSINILSDSVLFKNYIIFEIDSSQYYSNSERINCNIFFLDSLTELANPYKKNYYIWTKNLLYLENSIRHDGIFDSNYIVKLSTRYKGSYNDTAYKFFNLSLDNSLIFENEEPYRSKYFPNKLFFVFRTQFYALLFKNNLYYWRTENLLSVLSNVKVLIPYIEKIPLWKVTADEIFKSNFY